MIHIYHCFYPTVIDQSKGTIHCCPYDCAECWLVATLAVCSTTSPVLSHCLITAPGAVWEVIVREQEGSHEPNAGVIYFDILLDIGNYLRMLFKGFPPTPNLTTSSNASGTTQLLWYMNELSSIIWWLTHLKMVVSIGGNKLPFIQHYATSLLYMLKVKAAAVLVHDNFKRKVWILYPVYLLIKECVEILDVRYFPVEVSVDILTVSFLTDYEDALYVRFVLSAIHLTPLYICIYMYWSTL